MLTILTPAQCRAARAFIAMSQSDLARAAAVPVALVKGFEMGILTLRPPDLDAIQQALERAGIQFIEGDRPGLRLRK
jgi:predicted transcriptional regulator